MFLTGRMVLYELVADNMLLVLKICENQLEDNDVEALP